MRDTAAHIYLDYAAATPLDPDVAHAMRAWDDTHFANAFSVHGPGREAKRMLQDARFTVAGLLGVRSDECVFTTGATNGTAMALYGVIGSLLEKGIAYADMHVVMSALEHSSVRSCAETFMRRGLRVSIVGATPQGTIDMRSLEGVLRDDTVLVISMLVNNETGVIMPVREIAAIIKKKYKHISHRHQAMGMKQPLLFVDASQVPLYMRVAPNTIPADLLVIDAHKIYGPKRAGLLFIKQGTPFVSLCGLHGAAPYEGTPDVAAALGLAKALTIADERRESDTALWRSLKERLVTHLTQRFPDVRVHGDPSISVPGIINISFPHITGEFLAAQLDVHGIAVSAKSACLSEGGEGSYVVQAIDPSRANNSVRISFGRATTQDDLDCLISVLADVTAK